MSPHFLKGKVHTKEKKKSLEGVKYHFYKQKKCIVITQNINADCCNLPYFNLFNIYFIIIDERLRLNNPIYYIDTL